MKEQARCAQNDLYYLVGDVEWMRSKKNPTFKYVRKLKINITSRKDWMDGCFVVLNRYAVFWFFQSVQYFFVEGEM